MINVSLRVTEMPNIDAWAEALQRGAQNAAPAVAEVLREHADNCFETETDPWGVAWEPLKPATLAERERLGKVGKILNREGVLRGSLFGLVEVDGDTHYSAVGAGGPAAAYAAQQQFGPWSRAYLPVRPDGTVDLPAEVDAEIQATIRDAIDLEMAAAMRESIAAEE